MNNIIYHGFADSKVYFSMPNLHKINGYTRQ